MTTSLWTPRTVHDSLYRPERLLRDEAWRQVMQQYGGLTAFYQHLHHAPLPETPHAVLQAVTTYPGATVETYCALLHLHKATYHRAQKTLITQLAAFLTTPHPPVPPASTSSPSWHQLRPVVADFVGRTADLATLIHAMELARTAARHPVIAGIQGMGGVGKTELAMALAHQLIPHYPDAQLVLPLYGSRDHPVSLNEALSMVIATLQPDVKLPDQPEALQVLYQTVLAGKRVIILADDARDRAHVQALTPPVGNCLILTSRLRFAMPMMVQRPLEPFSMADAIALLRRSCPRLDARTAPQVAAACGALPLALQISASSLNQHPDLTVDDYVAQIHDQHHQVTAVDDPHPQDSTVSVAASLALSYARLPADLQVLARTISVVAADFDTPMGLATAGLEPTMANENQLYQLALHNLIQCDHRHERWRMHDLVRRVLQGYLTATEHTHTQHCYAQASVAILQHIHQDYQAGGTTQIASIRTFEREYAHIVAAWDWVIHHPAQPTSDPLRVDLVFCGNKFRKIRLGWQFLDLDQHPATVEAALRCHEPFKAGMIACMLANHYRAQINYPVARTWFDRAEQIAITHQDTYLQSIILGDRATLESQIGGQEALERALGMEREALRLFRLSGHGGPIESLRVNNLAAKLNFLGYQDEALQYFTEAATLAQRFGNQPDEARAWYNLGNTQLAMGQVAAAQTAFQQAEVLMERLGFDEGRAYLQLGFAKVALREGTYAQALAALQQAIPIMHRYHQVRALKMTWGSGLVAWKLGDLSMAATLMQAVIAQERTLEHASVADHERIFAAMQAQQPMDEDWEATIMAL